MHGRLEDQERGAYEGVHLVDWTDFDEQLYRALTLEHHLSTGPSEATNEYFRNASFSCAISEVLTNKGRGIQYFWKMPTRWYADPLNPWNLTLLIFWIPINVVYFCFQGVRYLTSTKNSLSMPSNAIVRLEPHHLSLSPSRFGLSGSVPYQTMTLLGYYANGLRLNHFGRKFLLNTEAAPSLFVALRHLAPGAPVASGLIVPNDFVERCSSSGRNINAYQMRKNPPRTWVAESRDYKPRPPMRAIVGYGIIAMLVLACVVLYV